MKTTMDGWESVLGKLPETFYQCFQSEKKYLLKAISRDARVLDVGCGTGRAIFDILKKTKNIVGIDHDERAVAEARNNFSYYDSIRILQSDAQNLPFEDEGFDFLICAIAFVHFGEKRSAILQEMKRVLKPDGKIILNVYSEDSFEERVNIYHSLKLKIREIKGTTVVFDVDGESVLSEQFSRPQLENIFSEAGFHIEDITKEEICYLCTITKSD